MIEKHNDKNNTLSLKLSYIASFQINHQNYLQKYLYITPLLGHFNKTNYRWQKIIQFTSTKDRSKLQTTKNVFPLWTMIDSHQLEMFFLFHCPCFFFFTSKPCPTCIMGNLRHHILTISKQFWKWHWYRYTFAFKLVCKLVDSKDDCQEPFSFSKTIECKKYIILSSKILAI